VILGKTVMALVSGVEFGKLYKTTAFEVQIFQSLMILEVIHAILGLVRSPVFTSALQITSRLVIIWPVSWRVATARSSMGVGIYVLAWSITEVVRYSFYAMGLFKQCPYIIQWARYTFFIFLYPMGVIGELWTIWAALPEVKRQKIYTIEMPNRANFSFSYYHALIFFMLLYIPLFPQLYLYMFAQRKKVLGQQTAEGVKQD